MIYRNFIILGVVIVFLIFFFTLVEIWRASLIMQSLSDPALSTERGFDDAEIDFAQGHASFKLLGLETLGVLKEEYDLFEEYMPYMGFYCGLEEYIDEFRLNLEKYKYNEYYVLAYNIRLKSLAKRKLKFE